MRSKRIKGRSKIGDKGGMDIRAPYSFREKKRKKTGESRFNDSRVEIREKRALVFYSTVSFRDFFQGNASKLAKLSTFDVASIPPVSHCIENERSKPLQLE